MEGHRLACGVHLGKLVWWRRWGKRRMGRTLGPLWSDPSPLGRKHLRVSLGSLGLAVGGGGAQLAGPGPRLRQGGQSAWQDGRQVAPKHRCQGPDPGAPGRCWGRQEPAASQPQRKRLTWLTMD